MPRGSDIPQCPGCHRVTEFLEIVHEAGANRWTERLPSWCPRCLNRKIAEATCETRLWS